MNFIRRNNVFENYIKPFQGLKNQWVVATPGFTRGYSHSATSWLVHIFSFEGVYYLTS
jgi:hypothetical protein